MRAIRVGICALVAFSAFAHGVVEAWSEAVLEMGAAALSVLWAVLILRQRQVEIRWNLRNFRLISSGNVLPSGLPVSWDAARVRAL